MVPPSLFKGVSVFVQSDDPAEAVTVSQALELVGAIVRPSSETAEIVVSPSRIPRNGSSPPSSRSRGAKLVLAVTEARPVRNVLFSQIPWFPSILKEHEGAQKRVEVVTPEPMIVVADARGHSQPMSLVIKNMPELHFGEIPRGYCRCPFDPIDVSGASMRKPREIAMAMPAKGFCEICRVGYGDAESHRRGKAHQEKAGEANWSHFDTLASLIPGDGLGYGDAVCK
jgi:hypothetical protein